VPFDLAITNTDNQTTAVPGTTLRYTVTVTNSGSLGVSGVRVTDVLPAGLTNVSWSAAFSPGSSGNAGGLGNVNETVNLGPGGSVVYTVTGTVDPAATGTLTATATVTSSGIPDSNPADDTAVDTDTVTPVAGVAVAMSSNVTSVVAGGTVVYTVVVTNAGPATATGVGVSDVIPAGIASASFTSTASGGALGNTSGSGNISDTLTLPPGASVTYTLTAVTSTGAGGTITNTAGATVPPGVTDSNPSDNTASASVTIVPVSADLSIGISPA